MLSCWLISQQGHSALALVRLAPLPFRLLWDATLQTGCISPAVIYFWQYCLWHITASFISLVSLCKSEMTLTNSSLEELSLFKKFTLTKVDRSTQDSQWWLQSSPWLQGFLGQRWPRFTVSLLLIVARSLTVKLLSLVVRCRQWRDRADAQRSDDWTLGHSVCAEWSKEFTNGQGLFHAIWTHLTPTRSVNPYCTDCGGTVQGHDSFTSLEDHGSARWRSSNSFLFTATDVCILQLALRADGRPLKQSFVQPFLFFCLCAKKKTVSQANQCWHLNHTPQWVKKK